MLSLIALFGSFLLATPADSALPKDAVGFPELKLERGTAYKSGRSIIIQLNELPSNSKLIIPRLANVVERVEWQGETEREPMTVKPEIEYWVISLVEPQADSDLILHLHLNAEPTLFPGKVTAHADDKGVISLPARFGRTYGEKLRFEPQPHKNTIGYWTNQKDYAEWHLATPAAGKYKVEIFQGCGKDQGGSLAQVQVAEQALPFTVEDTGHFQNFRWRTLGTVTLPKSDDITLKLVADKKAGVAIMDCREIRLTPVD